MSFYLGMRQIEIDKIIVLERARKDLGDIEELSQSIEKLGLLQPICVEKDKNETEYRIIDGQRRMIAYRKLGHVMIPAIVYSFGEMALDGEYDANMVRKNFTPSEAVELAEKIKIAVENRAKLRQYNAWLNDGKRDDGGAKLAQDPEAGKKTRDVVAKAVGMSHETLKKAAEVVQAAKEDPHNKDLVDKMDKTGKVDPVFKELQDRLNKTDQPDKLEKITPIVFLPGISPERKIERLTHLSSDRFKSGSVLTWIAEHLQMTDGCDILIQRRVDVVQVYKHHNLSLSSDVKLCSNEIGETQNNSFLDAVKKLL